MSPRLEEFTGILKPIRSRDLGILEGVQRAKAHSTSPPGSRSPRVCRATAWSRKMRRGQKTVPEMQSPVIRMAEFKPTIVDVMEVDFLNQLDEVLADALVTGFEDEDLRTRRPSPRPEWFGATKPRRTT
jgi:hypothetical protein